MKTDDRIFLENQYYDPQDSFVEVEFLMNYAMRRMRKVRRGKRLFTGRIRKIKGEHGLFQSKDPYLKIAIEEKIVRIVEKDDKKKDKKKLSEPEPVIQEIIKPKKKTTGLKANTKKKV